MEDERNRRKSRESRSGVSVVRHFAGSRIERQVVEQVFVVVWEAAERRSCGVPVDADDLCQSSPGPESLRLSEGVAA
jgi:hypothetical protein